MSALQSDTDDARPALHAAEIHAHYRRLLDALPVGVFTIDAGQEILSINPVASDLLGWGPDGAVGRSCAAILGCSFCGPACAATLARRTEKPYQGFPVELTRPDGTKRSVLIDAVPLDEGRVAVLLRDVTESERLRRALRERWVFHGLVCVSERSKEIVNHIRDVAPYDSTVLVLGESGTGKELVARAIHAESPRAARPFVVVNCAAYSETLLESELFGHAKGSFTGADRERRGRFELAEGGTVLLDEVGEISPKIQVKLLRVLQEREVERVGDSQPRKVDIRVLAATNRNLHEEVKEGRFREDLYYRLNVLTIELPPLRERMEDIPALAEHLIERIAERTGKQVRGVGDDAMRVLLSHNWPGNIRELENVLESAVVRARSDLVTAVDLRHGPAGAAPEAEAPVSQAQRVRDALQRTGGCVTRAARLLGVHRTTLWRHMREHGLRREDFMEGRA